ISALQQDGEHLYVAFCYLAVARCDQALGSSTMEALSYLKAGNIYWDRETEFEYTRGLTFQENLNEALCCYEWAIDIYIRQKKLTLAASLYFEMGWGLKRLRKWYEAVEYYLRAAQIFATPNPKRILSPRKIIFALQGAVECVIEVKQYAHALVHCESILE